MNMEMDLNPSSRFKWSQWINIFCISSHIQTSNSAKCSLSREIPLTSASAVSSRNKMWEEKRMCDKILPFQEEEKRANSFSYNSTTFGNSENGFALLKYGLGIVCPQKWRGERGGTTVRANELLQKVIGLWLCLCNQLPPNPSCTIPFSPSRTHLLWADITRWFF